MLYFDLLYISIITTVEKLNSNYIYFVFIYIVCLVLDTFYQAFATSLFLFLGGGSMWM